MLNSAVLMGRFVQNPELKTTSNNLPVMKFSLAVARAQKDANGERIVDWIDCVAWRATAEFIDRHFKKGDPVIVEGRIETQNYVDKNGNKRKKFEINVEKVNFCAYVKKEENAANNQEILDDSNDDLPF